MYEQIHATTRSILGDMFFNTIYGYAMDVRDYLYMYTQDV